MATVRHDRKHLPKGKTDWKALDKLSDEELHVLKLFRSIKNKKVKKAILEFLKTVAAQ